MSVTPKIFPGVDPFIEISGSWESFHSSMIVHLSDALNAVLPANYAATVELRIELLERERAWNQQRDVSVFVREPTGTKTGGVAVATQPAPATSLLTLPDYDEAKVTYVDIVGLPDRELVTSIELLSPSNKSGSERATYLAKRRAMFRRGVNTVELDFLLQGRRMEFVEPLPPGDYFVMTSQNDHRPNCEVHSWTLREKIPVIPVPLKAGDGDSLIDLGAVFDFTFERGRYQQMLRYNLPLPATVSEVDRGWASGVLRQVV